LDWVSHRLAGPHTCAGCPAQEQQPMVVAQTRWYTFLSFPVLAAFIFNRAKKSTILVCPGAKAKMA